jgi:uncharacterized protein YggT (Ycf19 family)
MQLLGWVHVLLNLVGLMLWLKWREEMLQSARRVVGVALVSTLRRAEEAPSRRWLYLGWLAGLVFLRAVGYQVMGTGVRWTPVIDLVAIVIPFRSDLFWRMLSFSVTSQVVFVMEFYFWLLLLSAVNRRVADTEPLQNQIRAHLGFMDRWPGFVKLLLPFLLTGTAWVCVSPLLVKLGFQLPPKSFEHTLEQALLIGLASFLVWKYLVAGLLLVHLITSYVFLGHSPLWTFVSTTGRNLLKPLDWLPLRLGKLDFSPVVGAALVLGLAYLLASLLPRWYRALPF